ncbi:hypothetical protein BaRGS_00020185 [Batillaria attramentaria]|uniref:Uncharacterized protein n=1 Tax=Batillaria attramentaria TaxID=370345 RepID=A0ABD0KNF8_9CAEN
MTIQTYTQLLAFHLPSCLKPTEGAEKKVVYTSGCSPHVTPVSEPSMKKTKGGVPPLSIHISQALFVESPTMGKWGGMSAHPSWGFVQMVRGTYDALSPTIARWPVHHQVFLTTHKARPPM